MRIHLTFKVIIFLLAIDISSITSCNFSIELSQTLHNEGFHRNLTYEMAFVNYEEGLHYEGCKIGIDQELPAGVYSNPDELEDMRRSLRVNAKPKNRVNVELSTEQSSPVSVYIIAEIKYGLASTWIPVHARYHQAIAGGGSARNYITKPKLFINCPNDVLESCGNKYLKTSEVCNGSEKDCQWRVLPYYLISNPVIWGVPVGNINDYYLVALGTVSVVVMGSLYLFKNLHDFKVRINVKKKGL